MAKEFETEEKVTREEFLDNLDSLPRGELEEVANDIYGISNPEDLTRGDIIDMIMEIYDMESDV